MAPQSASSHTLKRRHETGLPCAAHTKLKKWDAVSSMNKSGNKDENSHGGERFDLPIPMHSSREVKYFRRTKRTCTERNRTQLVAGVASNCLALRRALSSTLLLPRAIHSLGDAEKSTEDHHGDAEPCARPGGEPRTSVLASAAAAEFEVACGGCERGREGSDSHY
jgi:hypothetical protein